MHVRGKSSAEFSADSKKYIGYTFRPYSYLKLFSRIPGSGDDGLSMASGGTRQVPTTAMTGGMISDMLRHATSPAADGGCV